MRNCKEGGEPTGVGSSPPSRSPRPPCLCPTRAQGSQKPSALLYSLGKAVSFGHRSTRAVSAMRAVCALPRANLFLSARGAPPAQSKERGMEEEFAAGELLEGRKTYAVGCPPSLQLRKASARQRRPTVDTACAVCYNISILPKERGMLI